ncbi:MAG: hypothetical protein J5I94_28155 [Phaeodactylibacter sp.]|nr:hypothetical protein [Phaeodactylibacter sp.]
MKYFIIFLLFPALGAFFTLDEGTVIPDESVEVAIEYSDGIISVGRISLEEMNTYELTQRTGVEIVHCTYQFADGSCSRTAATCAQAKADFAACACNAGHTHYCPTD